MRADRDTVLTAVRAALDGDDSPPGPAPRGYRRRGEHQPGSAAAVDLLVDRLVDYRAIVHRTTDAGLPAAVREALRDATSVVIPPGVPADVVAACRADGRTTLVDGDPTVLSAAELDRIDVVVTGARVAIALSGTIVLDGAADQGRRAITLVPDHHIIVLRTGQVVETVAEAIAQLEPTRPLTMIAGPSATSDIELERVEGVHGPRTLEVIIVG